MTNKKSDIQSFPKNEWEAVWDPLSKGKYGDRNLRSKFAIEKINLFKRVGISFLEDEKVLESGCGDACLVLNLALIYNINPYGLDFSSKALRQAKDLAFEYNKDIHCVKADARQSPFPNNIFDHVISLGVIEHFKDPGSAISELHRVLKPGGNMILLVPNKKSFGVIDRIIVQRLGRWPFGFQKEYAPSELKSFGEQCGFKTVASFSSHRAIFASDKANLKLTSLLDRLQSPFRKDSGFYSWYIGCKL